VAEEKHGIELYAEDNFSKTFKAYDQGLKKAEGQAASTARSISKSGQQLASTWGTGVEDVTARMDALSGEIAVTRTRTQDLASTMTTSATAVGGLTSVLTLVSGVATGVGIALAALGAVGAALWGKLREGVQSYISETEQVIEAQERVNAEWEKASEHLAQALIPLKTELLGIEVKLAEATGQVLETFKRLVAIGHAALASTIGQAKALGQVAVDTLQGQVPSFEEAWDRIQKAGSSAFRETIFEYRDIFSEVREEVEEEGDKLVPDVGPAWDKLADQVNGTLNRIQQMQESHLLQLQRQEEDAARERVRAWEKYEKNVAKAIKAGEKKLIKLETQYEEDRTEALADDQEAIVETETDTLDERLKAQEDFEREMKQSSERFQLDQLQSQRRYEYERAHLVAEGDTLAIEQLDELYKLEQQEAAENENLQQRQAQENFDAQIKDMETAAQDLLSELSSGLEEQLIEQEQAYREQLVQQQEANAERLAEMAADFADQQRLEDEDRQLAAQRQEEDYRRQLADLGANLADQLREHEIGSFDIAQLLELYYGPGGLSDQILEGFHEREQERIAATSYMMAGLAQQPAAPTFTPTPEFSPVFGMQRGGIVQGPATFHVESGMREAVIPLGGTMQHNFSPLNVNIGGLAGAPQQDVNAIASCLARELTNQIRSLRRS
jgi:DNA repair exonuclease SbcCD ATPase subunit